MKFDEEAIRECVDGDVCAIKQSGADNGVDFEITEPLLIANTEHPEYVKNIGFEQILAFRECLKEDVVMEKIMSDIRDGFPLVIMYGDTRHPFLKVTVSYCAKQNLYVFDEDEIN
jgi:hypothetical protein